MYHFNSSISSSFTFLIDFVHVTLRTASELANMIKDQTELELTFQRPVVKVRGHEGCQWHRCRCRYKMFFGDTRVVKQLVLAAMNLLLFFAELLLQLVIFSQGSVNIRIFMASWCLIPKQKSSESSRPVGIEGWCESLLHHVLRVRVSQN